MKKTVILLVVLVLLVGFYFLFLHDTGGTSVNPSDIAFAVEDSNSIGFIEMEKVIREQPAEKVVLDRRTDGAWMVNGKYMANRPKVANLLRTMSLLQLKENLTKEGRTAALEKLKAHHITVTVKDENGKVMKEYFVGATNKEQTGNIMMLKDRDVPYVISRGDMLGYVSIYFSTDVFVWRENLLFNIPLIDLQQVSVEYPEPGKSFMLQRETPEEDFSLAGSENQNDEQVSKYLAGFTGKVFAESFASQYFPEMMDSLRQARPDILFHYQLFDQNPDTLRLFLREDNPNNMFGYLSSRKELLTVQHFVFDKYLVTRESLSLPAL